MGVLARWRDRREERRAAREYERRVLDFQPSPASLDALWQQVTRGDVPKVWRAAELNRKTDEA